jgi:hypothetical protein
MSLAGRVMVFAPLVVFGFSTKPPTMIRLFAELAGHYLADKRWLTRMVNEPRRRRSLFTLENAVETTDCTERTDREGHAHEARLTCRVSANETIDQSRHS